LSVSVILNDNFNGGEFAFFDKTGKKELHKIAPVQGDIIVFPSNFMYPHAVHPVKFGTRYAIVSWMN
jgi:predicted 2-oxoglutarate/Fe(II)-dependent dioxygenase YbiX